MSTHSGRGSQYIGRVFDMCALRGATPAGRTELRQTLFETESAGDVCTGVQKLAQRWVMKFLTIAGSMKFKPSEGTEFVLLYRRGLLRDESELQSAFIIAAVQVRNSMLAEETDSMHPEDRMGNATLEHLFVSNNYVALTVNITSLAGISRQVILPIPYLPIKTGAV